MSQTPPLLISVPLIELNRVKPDGSIFDARRLSSAPFSKSLSQAVQLVLDNLLPQYGEILCVARPEMFTHGQSLEWLRERVRGAETHLCISNGQALKLIPGMVNQAFVYGLHRESSARQYRAVLRRAPELLGCFERQYNAVHRAIPADLHPSPTAHALVPRRAYAAHAINWCYPFYMNRHSVADSVERMFKWAHAELPSLETCERVLIIDCNEVAMQDQLFCHALGRQLAVAARSPAMALLLVMPDAEDPKTPAMERMSRVLEGVLRGRVAVPRARMDNVHLVTELEEDAFLALARPFELWLHESAPLWACTSRLYEAATAIQLYHAARSLSDQKALAPIQQALLGRVPVRHQWTPKFIAALGLEVH